MTLQQAQQIKDLYDATFDLSPDERMRFLEVACQGKPEMRVAVEEMFLLPQEAPEFLEDRPLSSAATTDASSAIGRRVGPYQILSEIGRGGMGVVYLAQRADEAYQQQVAIKLVWPGIDRDAVNRFRQERQILARLNHPNIARLLDGGATEEGWQFLVMEYIEGLPINVYCDERQLSLEERLHLFRIVCKAVQYAHQNLVIHRDLKPSNILIKADGTVKLLDFGIAKLMTPNPDAATNATVFTHTGLHPLTPDYASPEQVRGEEITTASDVYSLGVVLYELLTGHKPYHIQSPLLLEVARAVCEQEPIRPSIAERHGDGGTGRGGDREKATPSPFPPSPAPPISPSQLRGDLDNIILKALKKEVTLRYASVEQFAEDLRRFSAGEPVLAQADTLSYRAGKFVRRHRVSVALAVLLLLTLLTVAVVAVRQAMVARQQAREQRRQLYLAQMNQAQQDWEVGNLPRMRETLERWLPQTGQEDLRGFEWRYLWSLRHQELWSTRFQSEFPNGMFLDETKDGRFLLSDYHQTGEMIEAATGHNLRTFDLKPYQPSQGIFILSPLTLLRQRDNVLQVVFLETREVRNIATAPPFTSLGPTSDPNILVTGHADGWVRLWDVSSGRMTAAYRCLTTPIALIHYDYSSPRMIVRPVDGAIVVWDVQHNRRQATLPNPRGAAMGIAPSGRYLLLRDGNTRILVFDTETGQQLGQVSLPGELLLHGKFTPDSRFLFVSSSDGAARLYELPTLQMKKLFRITSSWMTSMNISPDGKLLATVCADQTVKLWDVATQTLLKVMRGHEAKVWGATFTREGNKLATWSEDGTVRLWDVAALLRKDT
ncbi:MAG TPA: serine/threonine-protein kinase, partial [Blastocatellia bacterium]|nr:serine/threonine-protein kinase [Blastocatellia bacterium]